MKLDSRLVIEIVGLTAVVASLLFVGVQLLLDRQAAMGQQYHNRTESRMSNLRTFLESDAYMTREAFMWESGSRPDWWQEQFEEIFSTNNMDARSIQATLLSGQLAVLDYDNMHYQYELGLLSEDLWSGFRNTIKENLCSEFNRAIFLDQARRNEMKQLVQTIIDELEGKC